MIYDVAVADQAAVAIDEYVGYLAVDQQAPQAAETMLGRISHAIDSLAHWPRRCSLAPEDEFRDYEIRMRIVDPCILLFTVDDDNRNVTIIGFRHGRQRPIESLPDTRD